MTTPTEQEPVFKLRGANLEGYKCKLPEWIIVGPSDCGKTVMTCLLIHMLAKLMPKAQLSLIRKTYASMRGSVLQTLNRIIDRDNVKVEIHGGQYPNLYVYPNGSRVWVGGMDKPDYILSSERDAICVNQAEQISESDWEYIGSRCTGRGAVIKNPRVFGDCNPGPTRHWIRERAKRGTLKLFCATHKDNPELYDEAGNITPVGESRLGKLRERLSGIRFRRYFLGEWATAEGAVYEMFQAAGEVHVRHRDFSEFKRWFLAIDVGFTNPWAALLVGQDEDKRHHIMREFYKTGVLMEDVVLLMLEWNKEMSCEQAVADAARPDFIAALVNAGINAVGGKGVKNEGIHLVADRLKVQKDGRPRLTVEPDCINTIQEFESYEYKPGSDIPKDENNHAMDAYRYLNIVLAEPSGVWSEEALKQSSVGGSTPGLSAPRLFDPRRFVPRQWPGR